MFCGEVPRFATCQCFAAAKGRDYTLQQFSAPAWVSGPFPWGQNSVFKSRKKNEKGVYHAFFLAVDAGMTGDLNRE